MVRRQAIGIAFRVFAVPLIAITPGFLAAGGSEISPAASACNPTAISEVAKNSLAEARAGLNDPGVTLSIYLPTRFRSPISIASGLSNYQTRDQVTPNSRMLAGSIGKTLYAAAALHLADSGKVDLDQSIAYYMPQADIPNAKVVTIRQLLSHRSGYGEYDEPFIKSLIAEPDRPRTLADWVGPLKRNPPSQPGQFRYSDINFVLLAQVISAVVQGSAEDYITEQFLVPYNLNDTMPSNRVSLAKLAPGYAGPTNFFGRDEMVESGQLIYNPQFESGGGGFMTTSNDLSRWITLFAVGNFFSQDSWKAASTPIHVDSKTGKGYGLGIHIDPTPTGIAYGHSGYIPGYYSWARWYPEANAGIAIQTNTSDDARVPWDGYDITNRIAAEIKKRCNS